jgi:hypothetical protein
MRNLNQKKIKLFILSTACFKVKYIPLDLKYLLYRFPINPLLKTYITARIPSQAHPVPPAKSSPDTRKTENYFPPTNGIKILTSPSVVFNGIS